MSKLSSFQSASRRGLALDDLHFVLDAGFGSTTADHRALIRAEMIRTLHAHGIASTHEDQERLARLDLRPSHPGVLFSVSHCRQLGGYAWLGRPGHLGFDLEEAGRIKKATAERVSTPSEFAAAPAPALLWVAKEAAFKAFASLHSEPDRLGVRNFGVAEFRGEILAF